MSAATGLGLLPIMQGPTPLQRLNSLTGKNEIWMKRDDLIPFSFGGNKVRISISLFEGMRKAGCNHMIAYGSARSNLVRAMSNLCSSQGVPCTVVVPKAMNESAEWSSNLQLAQSFGAHVTYCPKNGVKKAIEEAMASARALGHIPYYAFGDSTGNGNEVDQTAAYVSAYHELLVQEAALGVNFDIIAHASGTGMTQAGLVCGQEVFGGGHRIIGISIARTAAQGLPQIERRVRAYLEAKEIDPLHAMGSIEFRDEWIAGGYANTDRAVNEVIGRLMKLDGVHSDPTYVGKALFGLLSLLEEEGITGKRVLFIHTGGTPLFFDHLETGRYANA